MANRTVKDAHSVKGTNPQYLVEKIIRTRIYECRYWKEECFALSAELLVDKAMELRYVGGIYGGNVKPTPFLCLILKMLQIQPEKDIIVEFIRNEDFKYVRALGAVYMRLTGASMDCYKYLEPLYLDYRKLKRQNKDGNFEIVHMDEFIDELLREERSCDIILPRIQGCHAFNNRALKKRNALEESNQLELRVSALDEDIEDMETSDEEEILESQKEVGEKKKAYKDLDKPTRSPSPKYKRSPSPHHRDKGRKRSRSKDRDRERKSDKKHKDRDRDRDGERKRSHKSKHEHRDKEDRHRHRHREHSSRHDKSDRGDKNLSREELEIQEANELRAKLGIAPLRP